MKFFLPLLVLATSSFVCSSGECIPPTGVGEGVGEISAATITALQSAANLPYLWLALVQAASDNIVANYETPIQFRYANVVGMNSYNVLAPYQPLALDIWGRGDRRYCVDQFASEEERNAHEQITGAYVFAYSIVQTMPETTATMTDIMENILGLPMTKLFESDPPDIGTPWGMVKILVDEMMDFVATDGWNANGTLASARNPMPYKDFEYTDAQGNCYTPYQPTPNRRRKQNVFRQEGRRQNRRCRAPDPWNWEPLEDNNGFGFFCQQQHVTPHIGFTGRLLGVTEEEYEAFSSPLPDYDWCEEADLVLEKTRQMATSDVQKMEVEFFDNKFFSLLPLQINWQIQQGFSLFQFWLYDMALDVAIYDAIMLVWRDKILFDLVRPTTVVHSLKKGETVDSYAGPGEGASSLEGDEWQPYIRTMPHAEYPSGSSCLCTAFAEVMIELTGTDSTQGIPLTQTFPAGSSKTEPGITPAADLTFQYHSWSETSERCGVSRENGGMHFSQAVPAGNQLCTGLAKLVTDKALLLEAGDPAGKMADFDDRTISVKHKFYPRHGGRGGNQNNN